MLTSEESTPYMEIVDANSQAKIILCWLQNPEKAKIVSNLDLTYKLDLQIWPTN